MTRWNHNYAASLPYSLCSQSDLRGLLSRALRELGPLAEEHYGEVAEEPQEAGADPPADDQRAR